MDPLLLQRATRGAALWLPPTVEPDSETFIGEVEKFVVKERQEVLFRILEAFE